MSTCAITGASGYLGSTLVRAFRNDGWRVWELSRTSGATGSDRVSYALEAELDLTRIGTIDALVHCAYDFTPTTWERIEAVNVRGAVRLFEAAARADVKRLIVISTLSAFPGC